MEVTINGSGFVNYSNMDKLEVKFGTASATIVSSSGDTILVFLPTTTDDYNSGPI